TSAATLRKASTISAPITAATAARPVSVIPAARRRLSAAARGAVPGPGGIRRKPHNGRPWAARWRAGPGASSGDRDGGQDGFEDPVGRGALELGLGPELDAVPERRPGQRLHVVGRYIVAAGQPGPGPGGGQQRGRAARGDAEQQRRRLPGGAAQ